MKKDRLLEMRKYIYQLTSFFSITSILVLMGGCKELYNLPDDRDFLSEEASFSNKIVEATLGRTTVFDRFNANNSSLPMKFEIVNARYGDGRPVTDIFQVQPTYEWIQEYNGKEQTLEEIENKRRKVNKPVFEIDSDGRFILWASATDQLIEPRPIDTVLMTQDIRFFDVKITNTGGVRYLKDFQFIPWRTLHYSPSTDVNPYTGGIAPDPNSPRDPNKRDYIRPSVLSNMYGAKSNKLLVTNNNQKDVVVYIRPFEGGNGNNLRFKFLDPEGNPIHPGNFNETQWDKVVHGFNHKITNEYVQYDVAYPIPLTTISTPYVSGSNAVSRFVYSRMGWNGVRTTGTIGLNFRIFTPGDWEIVFHFVSEKPKFEDE
ncbi:MAG: DUF5007 domain-containing protein [Sphingobacterium composti]